MGEVIPVSFGRLGAPRGRISIVSKEQRAYQLYAKASGLDEDPSTMDRAEQHPSKLGRCSQFEKVSSTRCLLGLSMD